MAIALACGILRMHGLDNIQDLLQPRSGRLEEVRIDELDRACLQAVGRAPEPKPENVVRLSNRQRQVLHLLALGKLRKEIALILDISLKTVDNYVDQIYRTLNVHNKVEVTRIALRLGV
jgi:DNA-binding NarL/FixJ family response regulator